jgi:hypothetical protein
MPAAANRIPPEEAETLCLLGVASVELSSLGEPPGDQETEPEALALLATGLGLYANLLELFLCAQNPDTDVAQIRAAARDTATSWRRKVTT